MRTFTRLALALAPLALAPIASAQVTHEIKQIQQTFVPANPVIHLGDTVVWKWSQGTHTITEGVDGTFDGNEAFHLIISISQQSASLTFDSTLVQVLHPPVGGVYDYFCVPHFPGMAAKLTIVTPWTDLGFGTVGSNGLPILKGFGSMYGGSTGNLRMSHARVNAPTILFVGVGPTSPLPFAGSMFLPNPIRLTWVGTTGPTGKATLPFVLPATVPSGVLMTFQYAIDDPAATDGVALSNGLTALTP